MPKVHNDGHGPYIRATGHVWRPQFNHTSRREYEAMPPIVRSLGFPHLASSAMISRISVGSNVRVSQDRAFTINVTDFGVMNKTENWSNHGPWTGQSEDSWFAYGLDLDDKAFAEEQKRQAKISPREFIDLLGLIFGKR